jgi:hypothetical protein
MAKLRIQRGPRLKPPIQGSHFVGLTQTCYQIPVGRLWRTTLWPFVRSFDGLSLATTRPSGAAEIQQCQESKGGSDPQDESVSRVNAGALARVVTVVERRVLSAFVGQCSVRFIEPRAVRARGQARFGYAADT